MWTVVLSPSVTCHSTDCYVCTSLEQSVYQTSNPRRQYHAVWCTRTLQFLWWTRKLECQFDILQWANNLLLLYDSVIRDERTFLIRNGLLLQEDICNEIKELAEINSEHRQKAIELQQEVQSIKVSPRMHSSNLHHSTVIHHGADVLSLYRLLSHIHITILYALHFDSNNWNYFVFKLQKAALSYGMSERLKLSNSEK